MYAATRCVRHKVPAGAQRCSGACPARRRECFGRLAGDRSRADHGEAAPRPRASRRRAPDRTRIEPRTRRDRAGEPRTSRARRCRGGAGRARARTAPATRHRRRRPIRPDVHRRRQGAHAGVLHVGTRALATWKPDRRRQTSRAAARSSTGTAPTLVSTGCAASSRWSAPNLAWTPPRSRQSAAGATTGSCWCAFSSIACDVLNLCVGFQSLTRPCA
jgi:hypothetical protein